MSSSNLNWRDTYRPARLFKIDARIILMIIPTLVHLRWYTLLPTVVAAIILFYFEKKREMLVPGAIRMVRHWIAGDVRPAKPRLKYRTRIDHGRVGP